MSLATTWRDFQDFRRYRRVSQPIAFHPPMGRTGLLSSSQPSSEAILREVLGWADIAVRAVAKRLMGLELEVVQRKRVGSGTIVEEVIDDHPLALVLRRWSPTHSRRQALYLLTRYLLELGAAYALKVGGTSLPGATPRTKQRAILELHPMHSARVRPVVDGGLVTGYIATPGTGGEVLLALEDVVYIWLPDPETLYLGEGAVAPQGQVIDASKFASEHLREHFQHDATPRVVIEAGADARGMDPAQLERWETGWRNAYSLGSARRGLPAFLPSGFVAKVLDEHASSGSIVPILSYLRDQIFMALGVPRSVVGDVVDANRAAAETNQYVFDLYGVKPYADLIADALTQQLAVPLFGDEIGVRFADFVPRDKLFELQREAQDLTLKVRTIDEIREERGIDPSTWGGLPVGSVADVPYDGSMPEPLTIPDDPAALADPPMLVDPAEDEPRRRAKVTAIGDRLVLGYVVSFERALERVFAAQQRRLAEGLAEIGVDRARAPSDEEVLTTVRRILAVRGWSRLFDLTTGKVRGGVYIAQGRRALAQVGGDPGAFNFSAQVSEELGRQELMFRSLMQTTTLRDLTAEITRAMRDSVEAGESLGQRASRIQAAVGEGFDLRRSRARTIARTEVGTANQIAQLDGWRQSRVVDRKRWVNSSDDAVRDSHEIDGQTVPIDSMFTLRDGVQARAPLDASLPPGDRINCRCAMVPLTRGEDDDA